MSDTTDPEHGMTPIESLTLETLMDRVADAVPGDVIIWADERAGDDVVEAAARDAAKRRIDDLRGIDEGYYLVENDDGDLVLE